ncbi:hypothetical protein PATA110616_21850 [Paenibacillus tarimensis]
MYGLGPDAEASFSCVNRTLVNAPNLFDGLGAFSCMWSFFIEARCLVRWKH